MKKLLINVMVFLCAGSLYAQDKQTTDSINDSKQLDEIVIVGQNQRAKAGELSFIPTKRQKDIAHDGYDMLRQLAMPQIRVDEASNKVTSAYGSEVAMYINRLPASDIEIKSLKTADILRVEYFDFPSDPHFQGAKHVINFVLKVPQGGGYTRLNAGSNVFGNTSAWANLFSKYVYKRMSYDLYLGWDYTNSHHGASSSYNTYSLLTPQGTPYKVEYNSILQESRSINKSLPLSFRAIYTAPGFQASNTVNFSFIEEPAAFTKGRLAMTPYTDGYYKYNTPYINRIINWQGFYYISLGNDYSLSIVPGLSYSHNNDHRVYSTKLISESDIVTDSKEDAWSGTFAFRLQKQIADIHTIGIASENHYTEYDINYSGTSSSVTDMNVASVSGILSYSAYLPINLQLSANVGGFWRRSEVNNGVSCKASPFVDLFASYSPNSHHQINFMGNYTMESQDDAMRSSNILQNDLLLYITGNPNLKPINSTFWTLSYVWMPSNKFFAQATAQILAYFNQDLTVYSHYNDGSALLRSYVNDGNAYSGSLSLRCTYKPIEMLQLSGVVGYQPQKRTGSLSRTINPINGNLSATTYLGRFYVTLSGGWASRSLSYTDGAIRSIPWSYSLRCGWGNGAWNIQASAYNIFSSDWQSSTTYVDLPLYSRYSINYSNMAHRRVGISVSYTFDYGKKVRHGDEIKGGASGKSAILK